MYFYALYQLFLITNTSNNDNDTALDNPKMSTATSINNNGCSFTNDANINSY